MILRSKELVLIGAMVLGIAGGGGAMLQATGAGGAAVTAVALSAGALAYLLFRLDRRNAHRIDQAVFEMRMYDRDVYWQIEALLSVLLEVRPSRPLPATRSWAASPDLLRLLLNEFLDRKPAYVLELGSGVSTVVMAYVVQRWGGTIVALEQDAEYADATREEIRRHGLEDTARVVHAPLVSYDVDGTSWLWYDWDDLGEAPIDALLVDGPSGDVQKLARYPAYPLLADQLADDALLVVDDAQRDDEKEMVERWCQSNPTLRPTYHDLEKGAYIIETST